VKTLIADTPVRAPSGKVAMPTEAGAKSQLALATCQTGSAPSPLAETVVVGPSWRGPVRGGGMARVAYWRKSFAGFTSTYTSPFVAAPNEPKDRPQSPPGGPRSPGPTLGHNGGKSPQSARCGLNGSKSPPLTTAVANDPASARGARLRGTVVKLCQTGLLFYGVA
jgi:hypothetical protein